MIPEVREELLERYDRPGPRYTSYPTAPTWSDAYGPEEHGQSLRAAGRVARAPLSLYVHVPFCRSMCLYCGCSVVISRREDRAPAYVDSVLQEAVLVRAHFEHERRVVQLHWGGGTPTWLPDAELQRLFEGLCFLFPLADGAEVGIEVDPRTTDPARLATLRAIGFTRLSFGVQDFDPEVQRAVHRVQSYEETRDLVVAARELGFDSINLDLIYGLPLQRPDTFRRTLELALELRPDRVACYGYAHVPWLRRHQQALDEASLPRGRDKLALWLEALAAFQGAGYEPIGMDHFAAEGDELARAAREQRLHRNFMGYTTRPADDMLAFGVTSISEVAGAFAQNKKDIAEWSDDVARGRLPIERGLRRSADDEARRRIILDLMCNFALAFDDHGGPEAFRTHYADALEALEPCVRDGLVTVDDHGLTVTPLGRLFVRNVCMPFDAYLGRTTGGGPRFSRTV